MSLPLDQPTDLSQALIKSDSFTGLLLFTIEKYHINITFIIITITTTTTATAATTIL
jgi:hypothetical protein